MIKFYEYAKCSTCVKAAKFLDKMGVDFKRLPIVDEPPTMTELKQMLTYLKQNGGGLRQLFNTSGLVYKEMKLSEKMDQLSEAEGLKLLAANGKLIKRPFVLGEGVFLVGFKEDLWKAQFK